MGGLSGLVLSPDHYTERLQRFHFHGSASPVAKKLQDEGTLLAFANDQRRANRHRHGGGLASGGRQAGGVSGTLALPGSPSDHCQRPERTLAAARRWVAQRVTSEDGCFVITFLEEGDRHHVLQAGPWH